MYASSLLVSTNIVPLPDVPPYVGAVLGAPAFSWITPTNASGAITEAVSFNPVCNAHLFALES